jgi:hypothetical protein
MKRQELKYESQILTSFSADKTFTTILYKYKIMKTTIPNIFKAQGAMIIAILFFFNIQLSHATSTWIGSVNGAWNNSLNWNPQFVPSATDDVVIPFLSTGYTYPTLNTPGVMIKSLSLASLAQMYGSAGASLTVLGNTIIGGRITTNGANMNFDGNVTGIGTLDGTNSIIYIAGDMMVTAFVDSVSTVILNGTALQHLRAYTFYNLTISNTGDGIVLVGGPTVTNTLTMNSGNIALNSQQLTLGSSPASPGTLVWTNGFFTGAQGSFRRWFSTSYVPMDAVAGLFPMGTIASANRSLWVSGTPAQGGWIALTHVDSNGRSFFNPPYTETSGTGSLLVNVRYGAKWIVAADSIISSSMALRVQGSGIPGINDYSRITISRAATYAPGAYASPTGSNVDPQANRVLINATDLNNTFYIASDSSINPLPVTLTTFNATYGEGGVNLNWRTASEMNNNHFNVERSLNGQTWETVGMVYGHGTTQIENGYTYFDGLAGIVPAGAIFYRLKQVDDNGASEYSEIRNVNITSAPVAFTTYPNPTTDVVNVSWISTSGDNTIVKLIDMNGKEVYQENVTGEGTVNRQIDLSTYKNGTYMVQVVSNSTINSKLIVKR